MDSILQSIKKLLGIQPEYEHFDQDIIMNINAAFSTLNQLSVGPEGGFVIRDSDPVWEEFTGERKDIENVKMYVYLKTRLAFDPPQMGYLVDAIAKQINELEWRLNVQVDGGVSDG